MRRVPGLGKVDLEKEKAQKILNCALQDFAEAGGCQGKTKKEIKSLFLAVHPNINGAMFERAWINLEIRPAGPETNVQPGLRVRRT